MANLKRMTRRERLHLMVEQIDDAYLPEAEDLIGGLHEKSLTDRRDDRKRRKV